jgi:haloalkane dehalogenase
MHDVCGFVARPVAVDGCPLRAVDSGKGEPIVFLHGNPSWSYTFRGQIDAFAPHFRVLAPDLLGFGGSSGPAGGADFVEQARAFGAWLDQLALRNVRLVLHDWGGPIGLHWAACNPHRVLQLVFVNTTISTDFRPPWYWGMFTARGWGELTVVELNAFVELLPFALRSARNRGVMAAYRRAFSTNQAREAILRLERLDGFAAILRDIESKFGGITAPVLVLWGEPDVYFRREDRDQLRRVFPRASLVRIPGGGHFPLEDEPARTNRVLSAFFGGDPVPEVA